jgi:tetratricopeptide (TPR) repeat protein
MTSPSNWGDIIDEADAKRFVGREHELDTFRQQISLNKPNYLIFYITGQGGVGKTTLLNRYKEIARDASFLVADCDEREHDVPAVLGRFAHQLAEQGFHLKHFDEHYKIYRQKMSEIENDPDAPQGIAALLGRTVVRATFAFGDAVPGLRKGLELLPQESLETQASEWLSYLAQKLNNKDEIALIRDPAPILSTLFFNDLNELAKKHHFLFCFENFEVTRQELQGWLLRLREYRPSLNVRLGIAGRDQPGAQWDALRSITMTIPLDRFTELEARSFLDAYGITNAKRRREILEYSGRLPVIMSWLAAPEGDEPDTSFPTQNIVDRFLRWIADSHLRQVALLGAIPRLFNLDIFTALTLLDSQNQPNDGQRAFDWVLTMPFVQQGADGWRYHQVVRNMMLHYQRLKSPQVYRQLHTVMAEFYYKKRDELHCSDEEQWTNEQWRRDTLAYTYHFLVADPTHRWTSVIDLFAIAIRQHRSFATEMIEMLATSDVQDELSHEQRAIVQLLQGQLQAIKDSGLQAGFDMFDRLCTINGLSSQAKGHILTYRGECYRLRGEWEKALCDFGDALRYLPSDTRVLIRRGIAYLSMKDYQEALNDLNQAIAFDEKNAWALAIRGETYRRTKDYQEALNDLNQAIALDEKNAWAIAVRGETYSHMDQLVDALEDFNHALTLDEKNVWVLVKRSEIYHKMGNSQASLTDLHSALVLDENYTRALASIPLPPSFAPVPLGEDWSSIPYQSTYPPLPPMQQPYPPLPPMQQYYPPLSPMQQYCPPPPPLPPLNMPAFMSQERKSMSQKRKWIVIVPIILVLLVLIGIFFFVIHP